MQTSILLLVMSALVGIGYAGLPFKSCKANATIEATDIKIFNSTWTCTKEPCPMLRGSNITVEITFTNKGKEDVDTLMNDVYGEIIRQKVHFPGYPDDMVNVCHLGENSEKCPIKAGTSFTEKVILPVIPVAPKIQVPAIWQFNSSLTTVSGCFEVLLKIV